MKQLLGQESISGWSQTWDLFRRTKALAVSQALTAFLGGLMEAMILSLFALVAVSATSGEGLLKLPLIGDVENRVAILFAFALIVFRLLLGLCSAWLNGALAFKVVSGIRHQLIRGYLRSNYGLKDSFDPGELQHLIVTFPSQGNGLIQGLSQAGAALLTVLAMFTYCLFTDLLLTVGLAISGTIISFALNPFRRNLRKLSQRGLERQLKLSSDVAEVSEMRTEIEAYNAQHARERVLLQLSDQEIAVGRRAAITKQVFNPSYQAVTYVAVSLGLLVGTSVNQAGLGTVAPLLLVGLRIFTYGQAVQQGGLLVAQIGPYLSYLNSTANKFEENAERIGGQTVERFDQIRFSNVHYHYPGTEPPRGVSALTLELRCGESVGLVGPSGSGKSTALKLLMGLHNPDLGEIEIDGVPLSHFDLNSWREKIAFVPQFPRMLAGTVADNVRFFRHDISDESIEVALKAADMWSEVVELEAGMETTIGRGFASFSGGQTQRLAIARALVGQPLLILMDEPSSAIDASSELEVARAVSAATTQSTVVIASHRPAILQFCSRVIDLGDRSSKAKDS